ncbi:MAG: molybdenum cofactor guanylyltransferase [Spirochaetaceae bacterium]|jgi:molybdopterin-guanine dinucleotide biosynthesis protein A|nr:molybdenum cofactor guanylyltransferase [Spirochaetaceae bacterium]
MEQGWERPFFGSALILAGGKGTRIGYDKKKLTLNGSSLMTDLIAGLRNIFDEIIVSSNNEVGDKNVTVLADEIGTGPLAGIYQGLRRCNSEYLYVIACDMPFLSPAYIDFIKNKIELGKSYDACVTRNGNFFEPFNALWRKSCIGPIYGALEQGNYKILPVLKKLKLCVIREDEAKRFSDNRDPFFNINYGPDLQDAERILNT